MTHIIDFFRMGLDHPDVDSWFRGMYQSFFDALEDCGNTVTFSLETPNVDADILVVPMGEHQDRMSAQAMEKFDGPVILNVGSAGHWFRPDFIKRWNEKILFVYGTDYSPKSRERFAEAGVVYYTLPFASNPKVMRPLGLERLYDVIFVGHAASGTGREAYMKLLFDYIDRANVLCIGYGWERFGYPVQIVAWGDLLNMLYNTTKVCVNILADEQYTAQRSESNNRLFDLAMAGCLQVSNAPSVVRTYFNESEVVAADSPKDWIDQIRYFLAHPEDARSYRVAANERALREHSWKARAELFESFISAQLDPWSQTMKASDPLTKIVRLRDTKLPPYGPKEFIAKVKRKIRRMK